MKETLTIQGIHCPSCVMLLTMNLEELDGVEQVTIDESTGNTTIDFNKKKTDRDTIHKTITDTGEYTIRE